MVGFVPSKDILRKYIGIDLVAFFVSQLSKERDICLFGFGGDGKAIYESMRLNGLNLCCICDSNWRSMEEVNVVSPEVAFKNNPRTLFVVSSHLHSYEMEKQLIDIGVPEEQIESFDESVELSYRGLLPQSAYGEMVSSIHYELTGIHPNLENPRSFNEKMLVSMISSPMAIKTELTDKYKVRSWVANKIGEKYLIPLLGDWEKVEDIPWGKLPDRYAMKLNHGCGLNILSDGKRILDIGIAQRKLKSWMKCNHGYITYERHYMPIKPHIICEEYIQNLDDDVFDYKIFCFHGQPQYIMFLSQRKKGLKMLFLDLNWNVLPFVYTFPKLDVIPKRPERLEEMLELTKELCKGIDQVRVDWYVLNDGTIKFGEMTFTSAGGHAVWNPPEWNLTLGDLW